MGRDKGAGGDEAVDDQGHAQACAAQNHAREGGDLESAEGRQNIHGVGGGDGLCMQVQRVFNDADFVLYAPFGKAGARTNDKGRRKTTLYSGFKSVIMYFLF